MQNGCNSLAICRGDTGIAEKTSNGGLWTSAVAPYRASNTALGISTDFPLGFDKPEALDPVDTAVSTGSSQLSTCPRVLPRTRTARPRTETNNPSDPR